MANRADRWRSIVQSHLAQAAAVRDVDGFPVIDVYADEAREYTALNQGPALMHRPDRTLFRVTGADAASWLHNLVTNHVKTLQSGEGHYAFALNAAGRILFDLNVLVRPGAVLLDLPLPARPLALKHLEKYIITEDIRVEDLSEESVRFALAGRQAAACLSQFGLPQAANLPLLGSFEMEIGGVSVMVFRSDFCGPRAFEFSVPEGQAAAAWHALQNPSEQVVLVGERAIQTRRIEAGLAWFGREIHSESLPAETGQLARAVSFNKGCYLGQEVVERMRSRGVVARKVVGLRVEDSDPPDVGAAVHGGEDQVVGSVTSACCSMALDAPIALAYVKTVHAEPDRPMTVVWGSHRASAVVAKLPFVATEKDE